ncbi:hypothetical protein H6788_00765 [Candidatus Nomurabacteria bacterium]|nr:hypothetical protein [Candidatus Nomurabacteria bacterium]MCB9819388.1 hypothetical protein [Candidatus Nomurabacteria bacterium]
MDSLIAIIKTFLNFLLKLLELFVDFMITGLNLVLTFAREVVSIIS